jgi:hypothetical protein
MNSTEKQAVFVHVPKTAGLSILQFCMRHGIRVIDHDIRNPNHTSLAQYRSQNPDIFSFALVRNPWDRVVSSYHFLSGGGIRAGDREDAERFVNQYDNFNEFVLEAFNDGEILKQVHFRLQYKWLSDESGLIVDQVGRFEKLQLSFSRWFKSIGLPGYRLPHVNKGKHKPYKAYYSEKTIEIIRGVYSRDIELFKYRF